MLASTKDFFIDLVLPRSCRVCGAFDSWLCPDCQGKILFSEKQICPVCLEPSINGSTHPKCLSRHKLDGLFVAAKFSQLQEIIHDYKYNLINELGKPLAQTLVNFLVINRLSDFLADFTLVPVPLHRKRLRFRGFNQSEYLAQALAETFSLNLDAALMQRIINTTPQTTLDRAGRLKNIKNAFAENGESAKGKKILLLDDITTTGATLNECAKVLKKSGATSVWALVLAHAAE